MKKPNIFQSLWTNLSFVWKINKKFVIKYFVIYFFEATLAILSIICQSLIVDYALKYIGGDKNALNLVIYIFIFLIVRWLLANTVNLYLDFTNATEKQYLIESLDEKIVEKIETLPISTIEDSEFHNKLSYVQNFAKTKVIENIDILANTVRRFFYVLYYIGLMMIYAPLLIPIIFLVSFPEVQLQLFMVNKVKHLNDELNSQRRLKSYFTSTTQDILHISTLKLYNLYGYFNKKIASIRKIIEKKNSTIYKWYFKFGLLKSSFANVFGNFFPQGYFIWQFLIGNFTAGSFVLMLRVINDFYAQSYLFYAALLQLSSNSQYVQEYFDLMDFKEEKNIEKVRIDKDKPIEIEFKEVSFKYPHSERMVLSDLSFTIKTGQDIAIVGHNGAGKSTLLKLLLKYYQPTSGQIFVNNVDLQDIDTNYWRDTLATLPQDVIKVFLPLKENIFLGNVSEKFDEELFKNAVIDAHLTKDIQTLPDKENTMLGTFFTGGINLSGGQWQKVAIARSLYKNSKFLIWDEPTSSIDSETEKDIFDKVFSNKNITKIVVSHKFSNIKGADSIIVLKSGRMIESGTHDELIKLNSEYARLYKIQSKAFN